MDSDREHRAGRVPLPGFGDPGPGDGPAPDRRDGIRHARRMSNWTLAALIAGTGAATVALAHHAFPAAAGTATTAAGATAATGATAGRPRTGPAGRRSRTRSRRPAGRASP